MSSQKKQKLVAAKAAMDALVANDERMTRILLQAAPIPPRWKSIDSDWLAHLATGVAEGSESREALGPLFEKLREVQQEGVAEFWRAATQYAWDLPAKNGADPFLSVLRLQEEQRAAWAQDGLPDPFGRRGHAGPERRGLNLGLPTGGEERWKAALEFDAGLAHAFWRSAIAGLSRAHGEPSASLRFNKEQFDPKQLRADSERLAELAADALTPRERNQELAHISASYRWGTEPEAKGLDEIERLIKTPARGFNAACAILEARGARWDARMADKTDANLLSPAEREAQKDFDKASKRRAAASKKAGSESFKGASAAERANLDLQLAAASQAMEEAADRIARAQKASDFSESLLSSAKDFAPAYERARDQLGEKEFWGIFGQGLIYECQPGRHIARRQEDDVELSNAKNWRAFMLRADSSLPESVAQQALQKTIEAVFYSRGKLDAAAAIKVWRGLCDFERTNLSDWVRWPSHTGRDSLPSAQALGPACRNLRSEDVKAMADSIGALSDLGVAIPWKADDLEKSDHVGPMRSALERAELNAETRAGRAASAQASGAREAARPRGPRRV